MCKCLCLHVPCVLSAAYVQRPEEGTGSARTAVTNSCELPDVGAGNWTRVLWWAVNYSSKLSLLLCYLSAQKDILPDQVQEILYQQSWSTWRGETTGKGDQAGTRKVRQGWGLEVVTSPCSSGLFVNVEHRQARCNTPEESRVWFYRQDYAMVYFMPREEFYHSKIRKVMPGSQPQKFWSLYSSYSLILFCFGFNFPKHF